MSTITILGVDDPVSAAAERVQANLSTNAIDFVGIIEMILGLIELFQNCRQDGEMSSGARIVAMAKKGRGAIVGHARRQVRKQGVRGFRNIRLAADEMVASIASSTPEEVDEVIAKSGLAA
jgi:hypothetical protein